MSEHSDLYIAGKRIASYQNGVPLEFSAFLTKQDIARTDYRIGDEESEAGRIVYQVTVSVARDRLDSAGYSAAKAGRVFEEFARAELSRIDEFDYEMEDEEFGHGGDLIARYQELIDFYRNVGFRQWLELLGEVIKDDISPVYSFGITQDQPERLAALAKRSPYLKTLLDETVDLHDLEIHCDYLFPVAEYLLYIRALLEAVEPEALLTVDFTDLIDWVDPEEYELPPPDKVIVVTEGASDARLLKLAFLRRCPQLLPYYGFLDFDATKLQGSAGQLLNIIRAFAACGIRQPVIGLFDNDTAGHDALRALRGTQLPENIKAIALPVLSSASSYPTIGPQGNFVADINGRAYSIELYLGKDALIGINGELPPIQWTGYNQGLRQYQGEIIGKEAVHERFTSLMKVEEDQLAGFDWSGIDTIIECLLSQFRD